jgi:hypothetical protein
VRVSVCVCVREREREREKDRVREKRVKERCAIRFFLLQTGYGARHVALMQ